MLAGAADEVLLDSYSAEREPTGRVNVADSRAVWAAGVGVVGASGAGRSMREIDMGHTYVSGAVVPDVDVTDVDVTDVDVSDADVWDADVWDADVSAALADGTEPRPDGRGPGGAEYLPTAAPGRRAPHLWLRPGVSILDLFGDGFVLLTTPDGQAWRPARPRPGLRVTIVVEPGFAGLYGIDSTGAVLVRPDGHVAARWRSAPTGPAGVGFVRVLAALGTVTGRRPNNAAAAA